MLGLDSIAHQLWQCSLPDKPVHSTSKQNGDTNHREDVVWISIWIVGSVRWDEWHNGEEDVGQQIDNQNRQVCVPGRTPVLGRLVVQP